MALITVSGDPGCRLDEVTRLTASRLGFERIDDARIEALLAEEYGAQTRIPDRAWPDVIASMLVRLGTEHHLIVSTVGAEFLLAKFPAVMRVFVTAPVQHRIGNLMLDERLERPGAKEKLARLDAAQRDLRKRRFRRAQPRPHDFDLVVNVAALDPERASLLVESAARASALPDMGLLTAAAEAQMQFQLRLRLARHSLAPLSQVHLKKAPFGHPSEEIFANLLDFYRISWQYEPKSFPIQWDKHGKVLEAFTPDFYLPEADLYVELTTMKQANVTKKNRKVKLLKQIYPEVNIQVFYQKDIQNLIFKHGLAGKGDA